MAGKDQHYDPRFLLKGFKSKGEGKKAFVWFFSRSSSSREVSTRDIGHSNLFYGMSEDDSLDARITTNKDLQEGFRRKLKERGGKLSYKQEMILFHETLRKQKEEVIEKEAPRQAFIANMTFSAALKNSDKLIEQAHNEALDAWIKTQSNNPGPGLKRYLEMN